MIFSVSTAPIRSMSDAVAALQTAAIGHSEVLHIDHDRMLRDYGCLWMLVRCSVRLSRLPEHAAHIETFLRRPTATASIRDHTIFDSGEAVGTAVQLWALVDAEKRRIVNLKHIDCLWSLPTPEPERTEQPKRLVLPDALTPAAQWTVLPAEIDSNGHLNNVNYIRHSECLAPAGCNALDVQFDRECFAGETLQLETAPGFFVRGVKETGEVSFRLRLWRDDT